MRRLAFTLVTLVLACGQETSAPTTSTRPELDFTSNPDNGNPRILRYGNDLLGLLLVDPETHLFSTVGSSETWAAACPSNVLTVTDIQDIIHHPDDPIAGQINELYLGRGVYIAVYQGFSDWEAGGFDCTDLSARRIAEGTGRFTYTDNDLYVWGREHRLTNAFGFVAQGQLTRVAGGTVRYYGVSRCLWDGYDIATLRCNDKIDLR